MALLLKLRWLYFGIPFFAGLFIFLLACIVTTTEARAQQLRIETGTNKIGLNELFTITVISEGAGIDEFSKFPDIEGFNKAGRTSSIETTTIGQQRTVNQRMIQNYRPTKEGIFRLRPFSMRINNQSVDSEGATITVGPAITDPAAQDKEKQNETDEAEETETPEILPDISGIKNSEDGSFLNLSTSKKSVFIGEGVHVTLYFYIPFQERNLLEFHNFSAQLPKLVEKIRQPNVWEEYFEQFEIEPENIELEGKPYLRFKLYEAVLFPLTTQPLVFPPMGLGMLRYRMLSNRSYDGPARVEEPKTYFSAPITVEVKQLPPHPLRDKVAVGNFRLKEGVNQNSFKTRRGFQYLFQIIGTGNITSLAAPAIVWPEGLEAYAPSVRQYISRGYKRVQGTKGFDYFITPNEPGEYDFSKFAFWVYFNPVSARYDTLKSDLKITVTGPSSRNATIAAATPDSYYNSIGNVSNKLLSMENFSQIKLYANIVLGILVVILLFIYLKK